MTTWTANDLPDFTGRTVIITGANSGLGLVDATELARVGAHVVLAVRDTHKGKAAARGIPGSTEVRKLDLADLSSVRAFAQQWDGPIDVLINNAGVMVPPAGTTIDGFETQFGTNHLGHFALTNLLLPQVVDRVVTVSSLAHRDGAIDLDDLQWRTRPYRRWAAYGQSKLANLLFQLELQRRLETAGSVVRSLAAHPGYASTNLQSHFGNPVADKVMALANVVLAQSAEAGAAPTLYAASQDLPSGSYVGPGGFHEYRGTPAPASRSGRSKDAEMAAKLWDVSEELTGVTFPAGLGKSAL